MRILHSLSFRLALIYVGLFCLSVAALLGLFYWINVRAPLETVESQVEAEAKALAQSYMLDGSDELVHRLNIRARRVEQRKAFHAFIDASGKVLVSNLPSWPAYREAEWLRIEADIYQDGDEADHEALVLDRRFDDGARLLVGRDVEDIDEIEERITAAASWILLGTLVLGVLGGAQMSRVIGRRIDMIGSAARTVIAGDLSGRVPTRVSGDDFDRLGETLNLMLSRIEGLVESVRRVSDNVAHELRTPLARLLASLEELDTETNEARRHQLSEEAISEARRLHRLFDALLRIARLESSRHEPDRRPVDLARLAEDAVEFHQPDAEQRGVGLMLGPIVPTNLRGDPDLIFQAISNLIDNALKYTPKGGLVTVTVERNGEGARLSVSDTGIGVDPADLDRLTERFYRVEAVRKLPGEGLGLSLVAAIAAQHQAGLRFANNHPGLRVELTFPAERPSISAQP